MDNTDIEQFPFVPEVERDLLPLFIEDRKAWVDLKDHVDVAYWHTDARSKVFKIFKLFFDKYHNFPSKAQCTDIAARKEYGEETLAEIEYIYTRTSDMSLDDKAYLTDECKKFIKENKIKVALLTSVDLLEKGDYLTIDSTLKDAVNWNPDISVGLQITDVATRFDEIDKLYDNIVHSPWQTINIGIGGGFFGKELTLFASASSVGKSIALDNCAYTGWDRGLNVVMITCEMSEIRKAQRMDAAALKIPIQDIRFKRNEVTEFYENKKFNNRLYIKEFPTSTISMKNIMNYLYQLELYEGLKMHGGGTSAINLLCIDYLDIMKPDKASFKGDAYTDQGSIGEQMRACAQELNIPVLSATQFSRSALITTIDTLNEGNLADSWRKMNTADTLIALHNTPEERINCKMNAKILKCRNAAKDIIIPLTVYYDQLRIMDIMRGAKK